VTGPFPSAGNPNAISVDPSGKFVYTANQVGTALRYTITAGTGALSASTSVAAGSGPFSIAVTGITP
jgi:6-phosphogluconolactonase